MTQVKGGRARTRRHQKVEEIAAYLDKLKSVETNASIEVNGKPEK